MTDFYIPAKGNKIVTLANDGFYIPLGSKARVIGIEFCGLNIYFRVKWLENRGQNDGSYLAADFKETSGE